MTPYRSILLLGLALTLSACGDKDDTAPPEGDTDTDTDADGDTDADTDADADADTDTGDPPFQLPFEGEVSRSAEPVGDGIGMLCVAVADDCPSQSNGGAVTILAATQIEDIDLSEAGTTVPIEGAFGDDTALTAGAIYRVAAFLDDDDSGCEADPTSGDLLTFGESQCPSFEYADGMTVSDIVLVLNMAIP
jgi:hypothetical protein